MMQRALVLLSLAAPAAAVFAPQTNDQLKTAVDLCLTEDSSGDCPILAGTPVPDGQGEGNYGAIGDWDVSKITSLNELFKGASSFNQDISSWKVRGVTSMYATFQFASAFNQDISSWDVSHVETMSGMFFGAKAFDQDISSWNVGSVNWMGAMFTSAKAFNQDISSWNVGSVSDMSGMFAGAKQFTHQLCGCTWVASSATQTNMFSSAGDGAGIASEPCYNFVYTDPSAAPQCYTEGRAAAEEVAREAIRPLIADYPDIVSEQWEAATASCGS